MSKMDFFVGSRMHATIGAFSMMVPTVSIAYSRKFQGLYNSVGYPYVIDAKTTTTEQAYNTLTEWTEDREKLLTNLQTSLGEVHMKNEAFIEEIIELARLLVDMIETDKYGYYHATNEGGYISWYDFCCEFYKQYGLKTTVIPVTTEEYGLSKATRPENSRLDKSKLIKAGFKRDVKTPITTPLLV